MTVSNDLAKLEQLRARRIQTRAENRAAAEQKRMARIFQRAREGRK